MRLHFIEVPPQFSTLLLASVLFLTGTGASLTIAGCTLGQRHEFRATKAATTTSTSSSVSTNKLVFINQPSAIATAGVAFAAQPSVAAQDASGAALSSYTEDVSLSAYSDSGCLTAVVGGTLASSSVAAVAGTASFVGVSFSKGPALYLKATSGNLNSACSELVTVRSGSAASLSVSGYPTPRMAGVSASISVSALDVYGNVADTYVGTITFTSPDGLAVKPGNYTFLAGDLGVKSFTFNLRTVGVQSITATDTVSPAITGTQSAIAITPASVATLSFTTLPSAGQACQSFAFDTQPAVTGYDAFGNVATASTPSISLSGFTVAGCGAGGTGAFSATSVALASGVATFTNAAYTGSGNLYLRADDGSGHTVCSSAVAVAANTSRVLTVTGGNNQVGLPATALATALEVTLKDTCAHPINGATVNWSISKEADGVAVGSTVVPVAERASVGASSATNASGIATITPTLGKTYGAIEITAASAGATSKTFAAQVGIGSTPGWVTAGTASGPGSRAAGTFHTYGNFAYMWAGAQSIPAYPRCTPVASGSIYKWDLVANSWAVVTGTSGSAPSTRCEHVSSMDPSTGKIYVWGGMINTSNVAGSYPQDGGIYDPIANSWTTIPATGAPAGRGSEMGNRRAGWFDPVNGKLLVWGGYNHTGKLANGGIYDGAAWTNTFTNAPTQSDNFAHAYDPAAGRVYVWSGTDTGGSLIAGGKYLSLSTSTWVTMATASGPVSRQNMGGVFVNGRFVVWSGTSNGTSDVATGGSYDPGGDTWSAWTASGAAGAPASRSEIPLWNIGSNKVLVSQGHEAGGTRYTTGAIIDFTVPGAPVWTKIPSFLPNTPAAYYVPSQDYSVSLGKMVMFSGDDGSGTTYSSNTGGMFTP